MTTESKTDSQLSDSLDDYTKFIRRLTKTEYFLLGFQLFAYGFIAGIFVNLFIGLSGLPYAEFSANLLGFYAICFGIPAILLWLMFHRNRFFTNRINKKTSSGFIYFKRYWRVAIPSFTATLMGYYFFYAFTRDYRFVVLPFAILFIMISIFQVFDSPLTEEGEIYILAESAIDNFTCFRKVQFFWKYMAGKIVRELKIGEFCVSKSDLVYYFSEKLLKTNKDLSKDLIDFRNFLLGKQRSCYEALIDIVPEDKVKRQKRALELSGDSPASIKLIVAVVSFVASLATIISLIIQVLLH